MSMYKRNYYRKRRYHRKRSDPIADLVAGLVVLFLVVGGFGLSTHMDTVLSTLGWFVGLSLVVVIVVVGIRIWRKAHRQFKAFVVHDPITMPPLSPAPTSPTSRYDLKPGLLTLTEQKFLDVLKEVVSGRYKIIPQMPLSSILKVRDSKGRYTNYGDFNRIAAKTVDFGLCDDNLKPHLVIELDDWSHLRSDRQERDRFVNRILTEAGLRVVRITVMESYDKQYLERAIFGFSKNQVGA